MVRPPIFSSVVCYTDSMLAVSVTVQFIILVNINTSYSSILLHITYQQMSQAHHFPCNNVCKTLKFFLKRHFLFNMFFIPITWLGILKLLCGGKDHNSFSIWQWPCRLKHVMRLKIKVKFCSVPYEMVYAQHSLTYLSSFLLKCELKYTYIISVTYTYMYTFVSSDWVSSKKALT